MRQILRDFPEITAVQTGPTRGQAALDIIASDFNNLSVNKGTVDPLQSDTQADADHKIVFVNFRIPRVPQYTIQKYSYRRVTDEGCLEFGKWLKDQKWEAIKREDNPSTKVDLLHALFEEGVDVAFKWTTRSKKTSEPSWVTDWIRNLIQIRRAIFKLEAQCSMEGEES